MSFWKPDEYEKCPLCSWRVRLRRDNMTFTGHYSPLALPHVPCKAGGTLVPRYYEVEEAPTPAPAPKKRSRRRIR